MVYIVLMLKIRFSPCQLQICINCFVKYYCCVMLILLLCCRYSLYLLIHHCIFHNIYIMMPGREQGVVTFSCFTSPPGPTLVVLVMFTLCSRSARTFVDITRVDLWVMAPPSYTAGTKEGLFGGMSSFTYYYRSLHVY